MEMREPTEMAWSDSCEEDPDWSFARNRQVILRTPVAEFSASVFSTMIDSERGPFFGPNRDYFWQGLTLGPVDGRMYRAVDGIYVSTGRDLEPTGVRITPTRVIYRYVDEDGETLDMALELRSAGGRVVLEVGLSENCWLLPLLDPRRLDSSEALIIRKTLGDGKLTVTARPMEITISPVDSIEESALRLDWRYKLGDGFREGDNGYVAPRGEIRSVEGLVFGPTEAMRISVEIPGLPSGIGREPVLRPDYFGEGKIANALRLRLLGLGTFGVPLEGLWMPEAGAWWFRRPWVRDAVEGLRWNLKTYLSVLGWRARVTRVVIRLLEITRREMGLPIIVGETGSFTSDGLPQLLSVGCLLAEATEDRQLMDSLLRTAVTVSRRLLSGATVSASRLDDSVICSTANSSWIDSVVDLDGRRWPARLPAEWAQSGLHPFAPEYGLLEVNALYIESLTRILGEGPGDKEPVKELVDRLKEGFSRHFKRGSSIPSLTAVPSQGLTDRTASSAGVLASAVLGGTIYSPGDLSSIWTQVTGNILVERTMKELGSERTPFGILVRDVKRDPYLGDGQYHGPVAWPRDTPYLMKLMEEIGVDVNGILLNNLDHMIAEGALGYCSELFSLPVGGNRSPGRYSDNPVPVKNPCQYWSHWFDPYLDHLHGLVNTPE